jgi:hypothetical protein
VVLVNGFEAWAVTAAGRFALSAQRYADETVHPDGLRRLKEFRAAPWPRWTYELEDGTAIEHELTLRHGAGVVCLTWRATAASGPVALELRPLLSGRDHHALAPRERRFRFDADVAGERVSWRGYAALPAVTALSNGDYQHEPCWYRSFLYAEERERGLDHVEDLASPGLFRFEIGAREAVLLLGVRESLERLARRRKAFAVALAVRSDEARRRKAFPSRLRLSADAYLVRRGDGRTLLAGYPWFADWGRDTFIAMRGLCLATGRVAEARAILLQWSDALSRGMLPNRFPRPGRRARVQLGRRVALVRRRGPRALPCGARAARLGARAARAHAAGHRALAMRRGRATASRETRTACCSRASRGTAHVDGREGRRPRRHAAHRQAGGSPGAVAERVEDRLGLGALVGGALRAWAPQLRRALLERGRRVPVRRAWTTAASRGRSIGASVPTRSSRSAGCRSLCSMARARGASWTSSRRGCSPRSAYARSPATSPSTGAATRAACASATRHTTKAPSGRGCSGLRRGLAARARFWRGREARGARAVRGPAATARGRGRARPRLGDRGRRRAAHATRLSVPGLVLGELLRLERLLA